MKNTIKKYSFQETTPILLPGEIWKDIEEYEGSYQVSNLGRVKSLRRYIAHPRLGEQLIHLKILTQKVKINKNSISKVKMIDLEVALTCEGKTKFINVRRLVYHHFVKPINYKRDRLSIINIDGDGFNCKVENLKAVTQKEKQQRSRKKGRIPTSYLAKADRSKWNNKNWGGKANRKPVKRIDRYGQEIVYQSIAEAVKKNNVDEKGIIGTCKNRYKQWKGFRWEYVKN